MGAIGDSIIRVSIIGDAKKLVGALGDADKATGGLLKSSAKSIGTTLVALGAVREGFQFLQDSTREADRLADATTRINLALGDYASLVKDNAGSFRKLGLSTQDVLEMSANFSDFAIKAGIGVETVARFGDEVAATAQAVSLLGDQDAASVVDNIGRAAGGAQKAMAALGLNITDAAVVARAKLDIWADSGRKVTGAITDADKATARLELIMEALNPKLQEATNGTQDLEQAQAELGAQVEELQGKLGGPLSDALLQVTSFINDEIDAIPHAIAGFEALGKGIEDFGRVALTPLANVADALRGILSLLGQTESVGRKVTGGAGLSESSIVQATNSFNDRNGSTRDKIGGP